LVCLRRAACWHLYRTCRAWWGLAMLWDSCIMFRDIMAKKVQVCSESSLLLCSKSNPLHSTDETFCKYSISELTRKSPDLKFPSLLWYQKVHYHVYKVLIINPTLSQFNPVWNLMHYPRSI
jgi:hypothetical protein